MEKKYYIQPKMETMKVSINELMLPSSPGVGGSTYEPGKNPAPARVPTLGNDSVQVF